MLEGLAITLLLVASPLISAAIYGLILYAAGWGADSDQPPISQDGA